MSPTIGLSPEQLAKLDLLVAIDCSGSMSEPSTRLPGKSRWDEVHETVLAIARECQKYDDDGITVITFASSHRVYDGVTADKVKTVFSEVKPGGSTMMGLAIQDAIDKVSSSSKEGVVIVFTDGEATDESDVIQKLTVAGRKLGRPKIGFCFVQVGNDADAKRFLDKLDNNMPVDVVATVREENAENLGVAELANLARTA